MRVGAEAGGEGAIPLTQVPVILNALERRLLVVAGKAWGERGAWTGGMEDVEVDSGADDVHADGRGETKYYCGFLGSELLGIFFSVFLPLSDAWSDVAVIVGWYITDQMAWFYIGIIIHIIAGSLSGCLCAAWELSPRSSGLMAAMWFPLGMMLGVLGLSPVASALVALSDGGEDSDREQIEREPEDERRDLRESPRRCECAVEGKQGDTVVVARKREVAAHRLGSHECCPCIHQCD